MAGRQSEFFTAFGPGEAGPGGAGSGVRAQPGTGPKHGYTTVPGLGFSSPTALHVSGTSGTRAEVGVAVGDWLVTRASRLSYRVFPDLRDDDATWASTYVALDLLFDDGTRLSELGAADHHGFALTARAQGDAKVLYGRQWNHVECELGSLAGKKVRAVTAVLDSPTPGLPVDVWISDVRIEGAPAARPTEPVDLVDTRRGTNAGAGFSRGNCIPAAAVPNGFTLVSPMTAWSRDWFYSWSGHNTASGRPGLHGVVLCHQPSPWMGDRNQFALSPRWAGAGAPVTFSHDNEVARPYRYDVSLDGGQHVSVAPTDHGAAVRFSAGGRRRGKGLQIVLTSVEAESSFVIDAATRTISGWVDGGSGLSAGRSRMFVHAVADADVADGGPGAEAGQRVLVVPGGEVTLAISTSYIGADQAAHTYTVELEGCSLHELATRARDAWAKRLSVLELTGARHDQLVCAYGSLYRVNLYPTSHTENAGTDKEPRYHYASPVLPSVGPSTNTRTGAVVRPGRAYVNHGFWDTYRTVWPWYALVQPELAAELADGFVEQFRTAGWIARWPSPGYADLMTGTSSDVAFADLHVKDVSLRDPWATYRAGLRNATVLPPAPAVGRKDLRASAFRGFPGPELHEAVSWGVEAALNDAALAAMAERLAEDADAGRASRLRDEACYLRRRSLGYVNGFDRATGFFQSRRPDGTFRLPASDFDPLAWGGDFTETNAWNFAFPAPHDGAGLAGLHGGPQALGERLDTFFAIPERADTPGTYWGVIHEMLEARDVRLGQFGMSNQPSHHIPFMYVFAQRPDRASEVVRDVVRRLFVGSEIGQGYPGDEDNGEMSAWYLWALSGLYPLQVGTPRYVLTAPALPRTVWHLPAGDLVIEARADGGSIDDAVRIARLTINGVLHTSSWIEHRTLAAGARVEATLTAGPSAWATGPEAVPPSVSATEPGPWVDLTTDRTPVLTGGADDSVEYLVDDEVGHAIVLTGASLTFELGAHLPSMYTLTCANDPDAAPRSWRCEVSPDARHWISVDERTDESFEWAWQIRPFSLRPPGDDTYEWFRISFADSRVELAQVELLHCASRTATGTERFCGEPTNGLPDPSQTPAPDREPPEG